MRDWKSILKQVEEENAKSEAYRAAMAAGPGPGEIPVIKEPVGVRCTVGGCAWSGRKDIVSATKLALDHATKVYHPVALVDRDQDIGLWLPGSGEFLPAHAELR